MIFGDFIAHNHNQWHNFFPLKLTPLFKVTLLRFRTGRKATKQCHTIRIYIEILCQALPSMYNSVDCIRVRSCCSDNQSKLHRLPDHKSFEAFDLLQKSKVAYCVAINWGIYYSIFRRSIKQLWKTFIQRFLFAHSTMHYFSSE